MTLATASRPAFGGRGYGYEAAQAWLTHGFETLKLPRICAYANVVCKTENTASRRILARVDLRQGNEFVENGARCVWYAADAPQ